MNYSQLQRFYKAIPYEVVRQSLENRKGIKDIIIDEPYSTATIEDKSKGEIYSVTLKCSDGKFKGAKCTCSSFEFYGAYCRHVAAFAATLLANEIANPTPIVNKIPYGPLTLEYLSQYTSPNSIEYVKGYESLVEHNKHFYKFKATNRAKNLLEAIVSLHNSDFKVRLSVSDDHKILSSSCFCKKYESKICLHAALAICHYSKNFKLPDFLITEVDNSALLRIALEPYGFTGEEANLEKYFNIVNRIDDVLVQPLDPRIRKKTDLQKLTLYTNEIATQTPVIAENVSTNLTVNEQFGIAFAIYDGYEHYTKATQLIAPLYGKVAKKSEKLKGSLYPAEIMNEKFGEVVTPTESQQKIIDGLNVLMVEFSYQRIEKNYRETPNENYYDLYLEKLKPLVPLLAAEKMYRTDVDDRDDTVMEAERIEIKLHETTVELSFELVTEPPFVRFRTVLSTSNDLQELKEFSVNGYFVFHNNDAYVFKNGRSLETLMTLYNNKSMDSLIHESQTATFIQETILPLSKKFPIDMSKLKIKQKNENASNPVFSVYMSEQGNFLMIFPKVRYDQGEVDLLSDEILMTAADKELIYYARDVFFENNIAEQLMATHPEFAKQRDRGFFYIHFDKIFDNEWYFEFFETLSKLNIEAFGIDRINRLQYSPIKPVMSTRISSGVDWFDVNIQVEFGAEKISLKDIRNILLSKERFVRLSNGKMGILPEEWARQYTDLFKTGELDKSGNLRVSKFHYSIMEGFAEEHNHLKIQQEIREKKQKLSLYEGIDTPPLPTINATLRPYQEAGYHWLMFLDEFGWGGCLADDMGLGKTLQMITFLKKQVEMHPDKCNLVVVPTSLVFNWKRELEKFAVDLAVVDYTGINRDKEIDFSKHSIVLTTYGLAANDLEIFRKHKFNYLILDESQAIKNIQSQRYKAVCALKARNRISMTGTPIENNTFDLYAQMNFTNPGFLGSAKNFEERFAGPIDRNGDRDAALLLKKMIAPFMMRRTKEQVAKDLPDKTEDIIFCEMEKEQQEIYNKYRDTYQLTIQNSLEKEGLGKSSIVVLDALLKLRQLCNSPELVSADLGNDSIKIKELMRHLKDKTGNHKVLVFSQFTKMLKLIEKELNTAGLRYEYLDGQTEGKKRQQKVEEFQRNSDIRIFLISLKAGGVGLNLTEADYVYLVDPWWNPAAEAQAIDRTHRIGQTRKVFAYRMICKNTIEEKILLLQEKKRNLSSDLISTEASFFKQLGKEDIMELFK